MRRTILAAGFVLATLTLTASADDNKGTKVTLDGMTSTTPASWVEETPSNRMRFAQFKIPKAKGDDADGELVIFKGLGGSAKANIGRWKMQFVAPKGKGADDVGKESTIKIGDKEATMLVVEGTFKYNPAPFNPRSKTEDRQQYKMIGVHYEGMDVYHIKMTGPAKTIDAQQKAFEAWLKGFKK